MWSSVYTPCRRLCFEYCLLDLKGCLVAGRTLPPPRILRHTLWMPSLPLPQLSYGGATLVAEKIAAATCGENTEESNCGCLILVINQTVAGAVVAAMQLWRGRCRCEPNTVQMCCGCHHCGVAKFGHQPNNLWVFRFSGNSSSLDFFMQLSSTATPC